MKRSKSTDPTKGKTEAALKISKQVRKNFLFKMGLTDIPSTILYHDRSDLAMDVLAGGHRAYTKASHDALTGAGIKGGPLKEAFKTAGRSVRLGRTYKKDGLDSNKGGQERSSLLAGLSRFSQNIGRIMVKFYCPEEGVVYDPFAGHNSRMELVYTLGRTYVGVDISHEFMEANFAVKKVLENRNGLFERNNSVRLIEGSSSKVDLPDNFADFSITSPPYWDLEFYGDEPEQLGMSKTYDGFIEMIGKHVNENFRILKPGSFCAWFINDFSKGGEFYPYHMDIAILFRKAGFILHNIYIVDLGHPLASAFVRTTLISKRFPKRHEYCVLGLKPGINEKVENHISNLGGQ